MKRFAMSPSRALFVTLSVASIAVILLVVMIAVPGTCCAGQKVTVGVSVQSDRLVSMDQIDHRAWDTLLKQYVDGNGNVAYGRWKQSTEAVRQLDSYLATLSSANPRARAGKDASLAFWINAYNAVTVRGILREYPTTSIRNHTARAFGYNIWKDLLLRVGGKDYSLGQIENEVLRKMGEPRIHFAIVCASIGCPRLLSEAYTAQSLDAQLTTNTKNFFANTNNFRYDTGRRRFHLSSIIDWYSEDFGRDQAAQLKTIAPYLPNRQAYDAAMSNAVSVSYLEYNWGLNDQTRSARR